VRRTDTRSALSLRSSKGQGVIRTAFLTIDTIAMSRAIGMNRAAVAHRAKLLLFFRVLAHGPVRRQDFIPIFIALLNRIHLPLMFRAIRMPRVVAKTLRRGARFEIEPTAIHVVNLRGIPYGSNFPPNVFCVVILPFELRTEIC